MKYNISAILAAFVLAAASPAGAEEWQSLGARAVGMGGAGVALSQGPVASYWNPASLGLATENAYGFQIPVGVHAAVSGPVIAGANDLKNLNNACGSNPGGPGCRQSDINNALSELNNPSDGARVNANAGGDFKVGKLAFFANGFVDAGVVPRIDNVRVNATNSSDPNSIENNQSALVVKGARLLEFGVGYGHELSFAPGVYLGGNVKLMNAQVGYAAVIINQNNNGSNDILKQVKSSATTSSNVGVDAGLLWDLDKSFDGVPLHPRIGVTGRNLNNPKFKQSQWAVNDGFTSRYAVNPQARLGIALSPFHWWNFAFDADLTRNSTPVDGVDSRQVGAGTEINVFNRSWINIPIRAGISRNIADKGAGTMLSLGTGINLLHLMIDASGTVTPRTTATQTEGKSTKIPSELGAAVQISLLFGGSEEDRHKPAAPSEDQQTAPAPAPADQSRDLPPAQDEKVRKDAEKAQQDLDKQH